MRHNKMKVTTRILFSAPAAMLTLLLLALVASPLVSVYLPYKSYPTANNICSFVCLIGTYLLPVVIVAQPLFVYDMRRRLICALAACVSAFCAAGVLRLTVEWDDGGRIAGQTAAAVASFVSVVALSWLFLWIKGAPFAGLTRREKAIHVLLMAFATAAGAYLLWRSMDCKLYVDHSEDATVGPITHWGFPLPVKCTAPGYSIATSISLFKVYCLTFNFYFWVLGIHACCRGIARIVKWAKSRHASCTQDRETATLQ